MTKFDQINFGQVILEMKKELGFYKNKDISDLLEFTKSYVYEVMEKNGEISKQNFDLMQGYVENIGEYKNTLQTRYNINISLKIIEKIICGQTLEEFIKFMAEEKKIVNLIKYAQENNLNKVWNLFDIKTKEDLIKFIDENKKIVNFIKYAEENNLNKIWNLFDIKTKEDLIELAENEDLVYLLEDITDENIFLNVLMFIKNNYSFKNLSNKEQLEIKQYLFMVESNGSKVFDNLFEKMKLEPNKGMYEIMEEGVKKYLRNNNLKKINEKIEDDKKIDISIYLRYGHTVDYPEIGEFIVMFVDKYLEKGYSKYIKDIKLLPRKKNIKPRQGLFDKLSKTKFYNIKGKKFEKELKKGIPFHLSHSNYNNNLKNKLYIISNSMKNNDENTLKVNFDLEESYDNNHTDKMDLDEIFNELVIVLQEIDKRMDKFKK